MYAMKFIVSFMFFTMIFPNNGNIVTIDQLTYYEPNHSSHIDNILPLIWVRFDLFPIIEVIPIIV
jgi:hypothetical protein